MSYTILYRSMFAKVGDDKYIPMVEIGDNNVYEGYGKYECRARDWQNWVVPGHEKQMVLSRQEICDGIHELIESTSKRYVNNAAREWDNIPGPYWTYKDIYKQYGWLASIAVAGKRCSNTTARMVENFFLRGFEQAVDMRNIEYCGKFPMCLCYYEDCKKQRFYYDNIEEFLEDIERRNMPNYWVEYLGSAEIFWHTHRNKRK